MIIGIDTSDDAGVYRLNESTALIHTVDFFTPVVDDPYYFGQIAAANALSDVYAMGGKPLTAMNIICYPAKDGDLETLARILIGGAEKVQEAGAVIIGGHSVEDREPKYGLAVTGIAHPDRIVANNTARPGNKLILTKALGTGVITTALKANLVSEELLKDVIAQMATLNAKAAEAMMEVGPDACTDITGFGLLGHTFEMAKASNVALTIYSKEVPLIKGVVELASMGLLPGGAHANRCYLADNVSFGPDVPLAVQDLMFDPQTSGGLLISIAPEKADILMDKLLAAGVHQARLIGEVTEGRGGKIEVV